MDCIVGSNIYFQYHKNQPILENINFSIPSGKITAILGKNGCGKSSLIKLILGDDIEYTGEFYIPSSLKISYISQDTSFLKGNLRDFANECNIDETLFKSILRKLDFEREQLGKNMENYSEGQKKKVLMSKRKRRYVRLW